MKIRKTSKCGTVSEERESRAPKRFNFDNVTPENVTRNFDGGEL